MSESSNTSSSSSSSSPKVVETPENGIIDAISGVASQLAQQMNTWAQQTYAQTSQITDQAVGNFFTASQQMMGLAGGMTSQYNNLFAPENADLVRDADSYASTDRQQVDMGQAGATQAQAGDQAIKNSEANLVSMGIDPSSGRYAALDKAAAVQNAANVAGAENMQRNQDIQTGQNLRSQAVQVGAQLPSAISNATNTAIQANTGASNAELANANTGANLNSLADKYLSTAMGVKLPLMGQQSSSQSQSNGQSHGPTPPSGNGNGGGNGGGPAPGGGPSSFTGMNPNTAAQGGTDGARSTGQPGSAIQGVKPYDPTGGYTTDWGTNLQNDPEGFGGTDFSQWGGNNIYQPDANANSLNTIGAPTTDPISDLSNNPFNDSGFGQTLPTDNSGFGGDSNTFGNMGGGTDTEFGNISYDPAANNQGAADSWNLPGGGSSDDSAFTGGAPPVDSSPDLSNMSSDDSSSFDSSMNDYSSGDWGSDFSDDTGYAGGGTIGQRQAQPSRPMGATSGGPVPTGASPSQGRRTDDVNANLNAGEFVVPKDVTRWKGEEFMHKLIADSRQKRLKMQAALGTGGKPMPQGDPRAQQRPTFQSQRMR